MKPSSKLFLAIVLFSTLFFSLRFYGTYIGYNVNTLVLDLGGLSYLYSTVGTIFAILAAFVIVSESQDWRDLNAAAKSEVGDLTELFTWSQQLPAPLRDRFSRVIQAYLETVVTSEWRALSSGSESTEAEPIISAFHPLISEASSENPEVGAHLFSSFNDMLSHRAVRVEFSWQPLPSILKFTVFLVDVSVVALSFFIGVRNMWLDYVFMACIATLGTVILLVIQDLDAPLRPGQWCLTPGAYIRLLRSIRSTSTPS